MPPEPTRLHVEGSSSHSLSLRWDSAETSTGSARGKARVNYSKVEKKNKERSFCFFFSWKTFLHHILLSSCEWRARLHCQLPRSTVDIQLQQQQRLQQRSKQLGRNPAGCHFEQIRATWPEVRHQVSALPDGFQRNWHWATERGRSCSNQRLRCVTTTYIGSGNNNEFTEEFKKNLSIDTLL